jgi:hypothetical protein
VSRAAHGQARGPAKGAATIAKVITALPADLSRYLCSVLVHCVDIGAVWLVAYADDVTELPAKPYELVVFANASTLHILRRSDQLHHAEVRALIVFNGEQFETAWGRERICGSLARWAWRQEGPDVAYYNEAKWGQSDEAGIVLRVRRKAVLVWPSQLLPICR